MKKILWFLPAVIVGMIAASGCAASHVYAPAISLPPRALNSGALEFAGGSEALVETQPSRMGRSTSAGAYGAFRWAVTNAITIQIKGWESLADEPAHLTSLKSRAGFSVSVLTAFGDSSDRTRIGIMPTVAFVTYDGDIDGGGFSLPIVVWLPSGHWYFPYAALGPAFGFRDMTVDPSQWGWGIICNIGMKVRPVDRLSLGAEVAGIYQVNEYSNTSHTIVSPSISISLNF
jgi:hypothetical protein